MRNSLLSAALCSVLFVAIGCMEAGESAETVLSVSELNTHPALYNAKTVVLSAYVRIAPEGHSLYESKEKNDEFVEAFNHHMKPHFDFKKYDSYCLTIANPDFFYAHADVLNGKTVVVRGKFLATYLGPNEYEHGACPISTGIVIDVDELERRYRGMFLSKH